MNQYEVPACIEDELPEIKDELKTVSPVVNVFKTLQCLTGYTRKMIAAHDFKTAKKCFSLAGKIYETGNAVVKNAVENVFVYAFPSMFCRCEETERNRLYALMPMSLYTAYIGQVIRSGI